MPECLTRLCGSQEQQEECGRALRAHCGGWRPVHAFNMIMAGTLAGGAVGYRLSQSEFMRSICLDKVLGAIYSLRIPAYNDPSAISIKEGWNSTYEMLCVGTGALVGGMAAATAALT